MAGELRDRVFYDGGCGLCHRSVRFLARRDPDGSRFRFAPIRGDAWRQARPEENLPEIPDAIIVHTAGGRWLSKSDATAYLMRRLGGVWKPLGSALAAIPRGLRDAGYDAVARIRHRLFARPDDSCPRVPPHLRERFES